MNTQPWNAWRPVEAALKEHFPQAIVGFRLQGSPVLREGEMQMRAIPTLPVHAVEARLDEAVGLHGWSFECHPVSLGKGQYLVKGMLSLAGRAPKEALGGLGEPDPGEVVDDDALMRCAARWGVGRYLETLDLWAKVALTDSGTWVLAPGELDNLRGKLPSPTAAGSSTGSEPDASGEAQGASLALTCENTPPPARLKGEVQESTSLLSPLPVSVPPLSPAVVLQANEGDGNKGDSAPDVAEAEMEEDSEELEELEVLPELDPEELNEQLDQGTAETFLEPAGDRGEMEWQTDAPLAVDLSSEADQQPVDVAVISPADPALLRKLRWLWDHLEKAGTPPLEGMDTGSAEETLGQLLRAWEERQQEHRKPAGQSTGDLVSFERYRCLDILHQCVHGGRPARGLESTIPAAAAEKMIAEKHRMLVSKVRASSPERRAIILGKLTELEPALVCDLENNTQG